MRPRDLPKKKFRSKRRQRKRGEMMLRKSRRGRTKKK